MRRTGIDPNAGYYMNVVSCYPHGKPERGPIDACRQNLKDQLDAADAEWVLVCGTVAMETLLPHSNRHTRGVPVPVHGKKLFGIYHPSYILRGKSQATYRSWQDSLWMFKVMMHNTLPGLIGSICIYCGTVDVPERNVLTEIPVCDKCMKFWRIDSRWRYMPPPQLELL